MLKGGCVRVDVWEKRGKGSYGLPKLQWLLTFSASYVSHPAAVANYTKCQQRASEGAVTLTQTKHKGKQAEPQAARR